MKYISFISIILLYLMPACNEAPPTPLPTFVDIIDLKDTTLPTKNLKELTANKNSLIYFYRTDCSICTDQIKTYLAQNEQIKNFQVILISTQSSSELLNLQQELNIDHYPNILSVIDKDKDLTDYLGFEQLPYNIIVNKQQEIVLRQIGLLNISTIENYITP